MGAFLYSGMLYLLILVSTAFSSAVALPAILEVFFDQLKQQYPQMQQTIENDIIRNTRHCLSIEYGYPLDNLESIEADVLYHSNKVKGACTVVESFGNLKARYQLFRAGLGNLMTGLLRKHHMSSRLVVTIDREPLAIILPLLYAANTSTVFSRVCDQILAEANQLLRIVGQTPASQDLSTMRFIYGLFESSVQYIYHCIALLADFVCISGEEYRAVARLQHIIFEELLSAEKKLKADIRECPGWRETEDTGNEKILRKMYPTDRPDYVFSIPGIDEPEIDYRPCTIKSLPLDFCLASSKEDIYDMIKANTHISPSQRLTKSTFMRLIDVRAAAEKIIGNPIKTVQFKPINYDSILMFNDTREQYHFSMVSAVLQKAMTRMDPKGAVLLQLKTFLYRPFFVRCTDLAINFKEIMDIHSLYPELDFRLFAGNLNSRFLYTRLHELTMLPIQGIVSRSYIGTLLSFNHDFEKFERGTLVHSYSYSFPAQFDHIQRPTIKEYFERLACQILSMLEDKKGDKPEEQEFCRWTVSLFKRHRDWMRQWQIEPQAADAIFHYYYPIIWYKQHQKHQMANQAAKSF